MYLIAKYSLAITMQPTIFGIAPSLDLHPAPSFCPKYTLRLSQLAFFSPVRGEQMYRRPAAPWGREFRKKENQAAEKSFMTTRPAATHQGYTP